MKKGVNLAVSGYSYSREKDESDRSSLAITPRSHDFKGGLDSMGRGDIIVRDRSLWNNILV